MKARTGAMRRRSKRGRLKCWWKREGDWLKIEELEDEEDDRYGPDWDPFGDEVEV
ncbi:hypothetical protein QCA50_018258 [Cerrena zonata]|uniref:Uncharacterized protein n=1 Tax=Cerrena zonata TaxID=2478898 RepID=A0AAW0FMY7_9APHY